jgi:hypothetical protein
MTVMRQAHPPSASSRVILRCGRLDLGVTFRSGRENELGEVRSELSCLLDFSADDRFRDRPFNALALKPDRLLWIPMAKAEQVNALLILALVAPLLQLRVPDDVAKQRDAAPLEVLPVQRLQNLN